MTNPLVILASPLFPNVPDLPGVPPIARTLGTLAVAEAPLLGINLSGIFGSPPVEQWGIMDSGFNFLLTPDSVVRFEVDEAYQVSDYPVEQGLFASYNKVKIPVAGTITMGKGGSTVDRQQFLVAAKGLLKSLGKVYIMVPEGSYGPCTIDRVSMERRASNGAAFILAHIHFTEIRVAAPVQHGSATSQQPTSSVPASAQTNPTTSTGLPNPTQTTSATSQAMVGNGVLGAATPSGVVNAAFAAGPAVGTW